MRHRILPGHIEPCGSVFNTGIGGMQGVCSSRAYGSEVRRVDAPQVDAMRQTFLSIGRRRFLCLRSLRGLLPLEKFLTTIR